MPVRSKDLTGHRDTFAAIRSIKLSLLTLAFLTTLPAFAQDKRGPSTDAERTKALTFINDLEKNPLGPSAKDERKWVITWLIEVPDIHVAFCTDLYPDRPKGDKNDASLLSVQLMISGAQYAIEHPGSASSDPAQYQAGMEGFLRTYEALIQQKPKDRQPSIDDLLRKREDGTLANYVKTHVATHCKS